MTTFGMWKIIYVAIQETVLTLWFVHIMQKSRSRNCQASDTKPLEVKVTEVFMGIYDEALCNLVIRSFYFLARGTYLEHMHPDLALVPAFTTFEQGKERQ